MTQSDFVKYWRAKDFTGMVPNFNKKTLEKVVNTLIELKYNNEDFRELSIERRKEITLKIFGDYNKQYDPEKVLQPEITKAINVGKKRINGV